MAAINDILGRDPGDPAAKIRSYVTPPPVDSQLSGAPAQLVSSPEIRRGDVTEATQQKPDGNNADQEVNGLIGYDKQIEILKEAAKAVTPETEDQRKAREKRERSKKIIAGVSDGLSALSNLFFTTRYAPNAYNPGQSKLKAINERFDALKAERQANNDRYINYMLKIGDLRNAKEATLSQMKAAQEAQKLARQKAEREEQEHKWQEALQPNKLKEQQGKADKASMDALSAQYEAANKPHELELKNATEKARADSYRASATNSIASAQAHERSKTKEFIAWDENGNEHFFRTKEAADRFAKQHGTWQEEDITSSTTTDRDDETNGHSSQTATTIKKGGQPARPKPEDNTPPSRRGNNDNTPPSRRK